MIVAEFKKNIIVKRLLSANNSWAAAKARWFLAIVNCCFLFRFHCMCRNLISSLKLESEFHFIHELIRYDDMYVAWVVAVHLISLFFIIISSVHLLFGKKFIFLDRISSEIVGLTRTQIFVAYLNTRDICRNGKKCLPKLLSLVSVTFTYFLYDFTAIDQVLRVCNVTTNDDYIFVHFIHLFKTLDCDISSIDDYLGSTIHKSLSILFKCEVNHSTMDMSRPICVNNQITQPSSSVIECRQCLWAKCNALNWVECWTGVHAGYTHKSRAKTTT